MIILFYAFLAVMATINIIVLVGMVNFMIRFSDSFNNFVKEHKEFQEDYYKFIVEVRGKKGLVDIVNRILPQ